MAYSVPDLPYDYNALEPTIDEQTMKLHHDKHHQAYVDNANKALEGTEWAGRPVEAVVVFPCVPATATHRLRRATSARRSPRWSTVAPASSAAASSGLSAEIAVETTTSAPSGAPPARWPITGWIRAPRSRSMYDDSARSEPVTVAPSACATSARPLIPAPPIPMK